MPTLFLIPTSLNPQIDAPAILPFQQTQINHLQNFVVETAKIGRAHLKQLGLATPLQQLNIMELNKHKHDFSALIAPLTAGEDLGLISDCGCPAVADPGSRLVALAHAMNFKVQPLVGPSSIILTLMASGLNGQKFSFLGYLPAEPNQRKSRLKQLEQDILQNGTTQIFIEAPFRNHNLFTAILATLNPEIRLCLGINLMTSDQIIISRSIGQWRQKSLQLDKQEVIFLLGK